MKLIISFLLGCIITFFAASYFFKEFPPKDVTDKKSEIHPKTMSATLLNTQLPSTTDSSNKDDNYLKLQQINQQLSQQISNLTNRLEAITGEYEKLDFVYKQYLAEQDSTVAEKVTNIIGENYIKKIPATDMENLRTDKAASLRGKISEEKTKRMLTKFHQETDGNSPDYQLEQNIKDFIQYHPLSSEFELVNIVCKIKGCEIFTKGNNKTWVIIKKDMREEYWYQVKISHYFQREFTGNQRITFMGFK